MSLLIVGLDSTIVNVALPSIRASLGASVSGLQWTIDAYTLVLASLLMLSGSTADRLGRRRVFQLGLVLFSLGSLLCALAPSLNLLIAARILQAIGGSMLNPVAMSIIRNVFEDPRELAQAIGVWGGTIGISLALGPVVGGALVDSVGWPAVFLVNLPIGLAAIILTARYVPESRAARPRRIDPVGQILVIVGLAALTYAIIEGPGDGWLSASTLIEFAVAVVALVGLVLYELRRDEPLIEIRFFSSAPFSGASAIAVCAFARSGRLSVPQHALPPGRARPDPVPRRPVPAADGRGDARRGARRRADRRRAGQPPAPDRRQPRADRQRRAFSPS